MKELIGMLMLLLYNGGLIAGTAYLVWWKDASPWWFLLTILLMASGNVKFGEIKK